MPVSADAGQSGERAAKLGERHCVPCRGGMPALSPAEIESLVQEIRDWEVVDNHHLRKRFKFPDFRSALAFVNEVGEMAEAEGHHPDIALAWGRADITIWTHAANGLTENDFILAAKIDQL